MTLRHHDVIIVGGGVTGTALFYVLARDYGIRNIALIEKYTSVAQVNSHPLNNAQTSHDGGTETNLKPKHAREVKKAAVLLRAYIQARKAPGLFKKTHRMVLGVGEKEIQILKERLKVLGSDYPDLRYVEWEELLDIEPMVIYERDENELVGALVSSEGYAINYQRLSECFVEDAIALNPSAKLYFNTKITRVRKENGVFVLETNANIYTADVVVFAAGAYSLWFAQELGYAKHLAILPVAGDFYSSGPFLRGKVYRMSDLPFAAIHADPDVLNQKDTRFGPTVKLMPLMERRNLKTMWDFIKLPLVSLRGLWFLLTLLANRQLLVYTLKNMLYSVPIIGKYLFLCEARVIVPSLKYRDLKRRNGAGGIRPQIVNLDTLELEMGDKTIVGDNCIFNTTPSPGASVCLGNAERDAKLVAEFLAKKQPVTDVP